MKDIFWGLTVSFILLLPLYIFLYLGREFSFPSFDFIVFQLLGVSLPEEVFFRGFLQDQFGNNIKGLFFVSIIFSIMHVPRFIFHGDIYSLLTFFPSLIMGFLYMKTSNVLPSIIFHFLSNIVFLGFMIYF
ncbi:MAG: CPBP family intramembrane glutamic endopeptidase [Nitrospirota bacterium]